MAPCFPNKIGMNNPSVLILKGADMEPSHVLSESQDIFKVSSIRGCFIFIKLLIQMGTRPIFLKRLVIIQMTKTHNRRQQI